MVYIYYMKRLVYLLLILLLLSTNKAEAQPYKSVFGDSVTFHTATFRGLAMHSLYIHIKKDTLVNGLNYKQVFYEFNKPSSNPSQLGLLREDTITGKIWYRSVTSGFFHPDRDTIDKLIMNMDLDRGDTFIVGKNFIVPDTLYVDTSYVIMGRKHILFSDSVTTPYGVRYPFEFIEGIGTSFGLCYKDSNELVGTAGTERYSLLVCTFHDSVHTYTTPAISVFLDSCIAYLGVDDIKEEDQISIYPNPSKGEFTLVANTDIDEVMITDINGRIVKGIQVEKYGNIYIDLRGEPAGLYFLKIIAGENIYYSKILLE